jgi:hypothetical protein
MIFGKAPTHSRRNCERRLLQKKNYESERVNIEFVSCEVLREGRADAVY